GQDVDTDTQRGLKKLGKGKRVFTQSDKQAWWSQIKFYQRQRSSMGKPVSDGWCSHTFHDKFSEWPNGLSDFPMEITPEVSSYIKHKRISFAKGREKLKSPDQQCNTGNIDATAAIIDARNHLEEIRKSLRKAV
ncbi:DEAD/DEAH box helicase, partial [Yersinia enterocolitica]